MKTSDLKRRYRFTTPDSEGRSQRKLVVMFRGWEGYVERGTDTCSGCCELGDYGGGSENYATDPKHGCLVGMGCDECGYTGKRRWDHWFAFDMDAYLAWESKRWARRERLEEYFRRRRAEVAA